MKSGIGKPGPPLPGSSWCLCFFVHLRFSAAVCPQKCKLAAAQLRLTATGSNDRSETIAFPSHNGEGLPSGFDIGGALNLDPVQATLYGRNRCVRSPERRHTADTLW